MPPHRISDVDEQHGIGTCAVCGPAVPIMRQASNGRTPYWRCRHKVRAEMREVMRRRTRRLAFEREAQGIYPRPWLSGYRLYVKDHCERCGFVAEHPAQLHVHHRDRSRANGDPDNLETVCANCHVLEHAAPADSFSRPDERQRRLI